MQPFDPPQQPQPPQPSPYVPVAPFAGQGYVAPPPPDGKAIGALVLGILSITCGGLFLGIPAIVLGVMSRRENPQGSSDRGVPAIVGIVLGALGTVASLALLGVALVGMVTNARTHSSPPPSTAGTSTPVAAASGGTTAVVDLAPKAGKLHDELAKRERDATGKGQTLLVETTATRCKACNEIDSSLGDGRMQAALTNVVLVRINADRFAPELKALSMYEGSVPWFYLIDSAGHPSDAISADEWDDNIPENIAPVLDAFVHHSLTHRRQGSHLGTPL